MSTADVGDLSIHDPLIVDLYHLRWDLNHDESMQAVQELLRALEKAINEWPSGREPPLCLRVYPTPVVYSNANNRETRWSKYLEHQPQLRSEYTDEEWEAEKQAFGIVGDAAARGWQHNCFYLMANTQNPVFFHGWHRRLHGGADTPAARQQHTEGDIEWHEFVFVLSMRRVFIYDPSYEPPNPPLLAARRRTIGDVPLCGTKAREMIRALRRRRLTVAEVYIGGGGNTTGTCRAMSLRWLRDTVIAAILLDDPATFDIAKEDRGLQGRVWERVSR